VDGVGRFGVDIYKLAADTTALKTGLTVGKLDSTKGEVDHCGISFFDEVVLCEPLDVQNEVRR
jgi:hypothetical protein